ncbi:MAG: copper chaperone PCu(A)C [Rhodospirillaceae bacterium]
MIRSLKFALAALVVSAAPALAQAKPVVIENAWIRLHEGMVSAYFHILNNSEEPDRLLAVSTPRAEKAELLRTRIRSGKYVYQPVTDLEITGYDDERLRPGGLFVRLSGVKDRLAVGDIVPLTLRFERSGTIEVTARVSNQLLGNR